MPSLRSLFAAHGAPLVLKSDNGSHFICGSVRALCLRWGVQLLLSPVRTPSYNGACESGIGWIKTRTHHLAARDGDPARWSCDHIEAARLQGNRRPRRDGQTAESLWQGRSAIAAWERDRFRLAVERAQQRLRQQLPVDDVPPSPDVIRRRALAGLLVEAGYLTIRRRPVPQPVPGVFSERIP